MGSGVGVALGAGVGVGPGVLVGGGTGVTVGRAVGTAVDTAVGMAVGTADGARVADRAGFVAVGCSFSSLFEEEQDPTTVIKNMTAIARTVGRIGLFN